MRHLNQRRLDLKDWKNNQDIVVPRNAILFTPSQSSNAAAYFLVKLEESDEYIMHKAVKTGKSGPVGPNHKFKIDPETAEKLRKAKFLDIEVLDLYDKNDNYNGYVKELSFKINGREVVTVSGDNASHFNTKNDNTDLGAQIRAQTTFMKDAISPVESAKKSIDLTNNLFTPTARSNSTYTLKQQEGDIYSLCKNYLPLGSNADNQFAFSADTELTMARFTINDQLAGQEITISGLKLRGNEKGPAEITLNIGEQKLKIGLASLEKGTPVDLGAAYMEAVQDSEVSRRSPAMVRRKQSLELVTRTTAWGKGRGGPSTRALEDGEVAKYNNLPHFTPGGAVFASPVPAITNSDNMTMEEVLHAMNTNREEAEARFNRNDEQEEEPRMSDPADVAAHREAISARNAVLMENGALNRESTSGGPPITGNSRAAARADSVASARSAWGAPRTDYSLSGRTTPPPQEIDTASPIDKTDQISALVDALIILRKFNRGRQIGTGKKSISQEDLNGAYKEVVKLTPNIVAKSLSRDANKNDLKTATSALIEKGSLGSAKYQDTIKAAINSKVNGLFSAGRKRRTFNELGNLSIDTATPTQNQGSIIGGAGSGEVIYDTTSISSATNAGNEAADDLYSTVSSTKAQRARSGGTTRSEESLYSAMDLTQTGPGVIGGGTAANDTVIYADISHPSKPMPEFVEEVNMEGTYDVVDNSTSAQNQNAAEVAVNSLQNKTPVGQNTDSAYETDQDVLISPNPDYEAAGPESSYIAVRSLVDTPRVINLTNPTASSESAYSLKETGAGTNEYELIKKKGETVTTFPANAEVSAKYKFSPQEAPQFEGAKISVDRDFRLKLEIISNDKNIKISTGGGLERSPGTTPGQAEARALSPVLVLKRKNSGMNRSDSTSSLASVGSHASNTSA